MTSERSFDLTRSILHRTANKWKRNYVYVIETMLRAQRAKTTVWTRLRNGSDPSIFVSGCP